MFIIEKPYISDFLIETVKKNGYPVLENEAIKEMEIDLSGINLITSDEAKSIYENEKYPRIYTNSENSIDWVTTNLPNSSLCRYIKICKDKVIFRNLLKDIYPNFYFRSVKVDELKILNPAEIKFPIIIKPSIGFLSLGVHAVKDSTEWKNVVNMIYNEIKKVKSFYPESVLNLSEFIIEEMIQGKEYAVDAYYDENGKISVMNIFHHPFFDEKDVSDRIYLMSPDYIKKYRKSFEKLLTKIGEKEDIRNFPIHLEARITDSGEIIPIEINPMRFAGWCTTDSSNCAWQYNIYENFCNNISPDWNKILDNNKSKYYYFSMAEVSSDIERSKIKGFDYDRLLKIYSNPMIIRKIDYKVHPMFAIIFGSAESDEEIKNILAYKTKDYVLY